MRADNKYQENLQLARGPEEMKDAKSLEQQMGFNYCQAIGELIYVYTICWIDIAIPVITLSQFSQHPAEIHYQAVKDVLTYLMPQKNMASHIGDPHPEKISC